MAARLRDDMRTALVGDGDVANGMYVYKAIFSGQLSREEFDLSSYDES